MPAKPKIKLLTIEHSLLALLLMTVVCHFVTFVSLAWWRCAQAYLIEANESLMIEHVTRVMHGQPLYQQPTLEFTPILYPPLFSYVGALICRMSGPSLVALRLMSLGSVGVVSAILWSWCRRATDHSRLAGVVAISFFLASNAYADRFLDTARVDALALGLSLVAVYCLQLKASKYNSEVMLGAICAALAVGTKQTSLLVVVPPTLLLLARGPVRAQVIYCLTFTLTGLVLLAITLTWFGEARWLWYYLVELPRSHRILPGRLGHVFAGLIPFLPTIALAVSLGAGGTASGQVVMAWCWGALAVAVLGLLKHGGANNHLLPLYAGLSVLGVVIVWGRKADKQFPQRLSLSLLLLQSLLLWQHPGRAVQETQNLRPNDELRQVWRMLTPNSLVLHHYAYLLAPSGPPRQVHVSALGDLLNLPLPEKQYEPIREELTHKLVTAQYDFVVASDWADLVLSPDLIRQHYVPIREIPAGPNSTCLDVTHAVVYRARRLGAIDTLTLAPSPLPAAASK